MTELSPAEAHADAKGLPKILMVPHELLNVMAGNALIVSTADGDEALVRLFTPDELLATHKRSVEKLRGQGVPLEPSMTLAQAENLTRPVDLLSRLPGGGS